jgi:hypothetical protein
LTKIFIVLALLLLISIGSGFEVSTSNPNPGDKVILSGIASPGGQVSLRSSFTMNLPVAAGQYEYETRLDVPQKPNRFTLTVRKVKDFNAGVKIGIWITKGFAASDGTVTFSQADVPPGTYDLKMFGEALPGSSQVPVEVVAETTVEADSQGKYGMVIDTSGIPGGDYRIEGAGDSKTIHIGGSSETSQTSQSTSSGDDGGNTYTEPKPAPVEITSPVIKWYASQIGLSINNSSQYDTAEKRLKERLSGGYWQVIARGDPMTEEAGNCEQDYCLVRGIDACRICREKDAQLKSINLSEKPRLESNISLQNLSKPSRIDTENKNSIDTIIDWIEGLLGFGKTG